MSGGDVVELRALLLDSAGETPADLGEELFAATFDPTVDVATSAALIPRPEVFAGYDGVGSEEAGEDGAADASDHDDLSTDDPDDLYADVDPAGDPDPGPDADDHPDPGSDGDGWHPLADGGS